MFDRLREGSIPRRAGGIGRGQIPRHNPPLSLISSDRLVPSRPGIESRERRREWHHGEMLDTSRGLLESMAAAKQWFCDGRESDKLCIQPRGSIRETLNGLVHCIWNFLHGLSQSLAQLRPLVRCGISAPKQQMEHVFKVRLPELLQRIPSKEKSASLMVSAANVSR